MLNPQAKGALDPRAQSFLHLIQEVLPELAARGAHPTHFLVENVAGFEASTTRKILISTLQNLGYSTVELLLTPLQFGIPNSRLRYYLLAKRAPHSFSDCAAREPLWSIPCMEPVAHVDELRQYLDSEPDERCTIPDRVLVKWGRLFDIVLPSARRTCCFTRGYTQLVERAGSILQMSESLDTTTVFDTFLAQKAEDAVRMLDPLRLRYFSPDELLRIFAFRPVSGDAPAFVWPPGLSRKVQYRLIGNSVNVRVVEELIRYLFRESEPALAIGK
ncbi:Dna methyltransferase [Mycena chlorophos]|uniref:tRNA (cytosine(38)-C(5))-methyltransferase n=1 Tax=Mycena chlorophos TaxID=658473 RepID=A0A8H6WBM0_MYCCL|nr:Dna methyltransferase [Mycena chlorophos]